MPLVEPKLEHRHHKQKKYPESNRKSAGRLYLYIFFRFWTQHSCSEIRYGHLSDHPSSHPSTIVDENIYFSGQILTECCPRTLGLGNLNKINNGHDCATEIIGRWGTYVALVPEHISRFSFIFHSAIKSRSHLSQKIFVFYFKSPQRNKVFS